MSETFSFFLQNTLITIITMACVHAFLFSNRSIPKEIRRKFVILTTVLMLEGLEAYADFVLSLRTDGTLGILRIAVSAVGYTLRPLMLYLVLLIMLRDWKWKAKNQVLAIPTIITAICCIFAFFTKWTFYYTEENYFRGGPLRYVIFAMLALYFVMILVANVIGTRKNRKEGIVLFGVIALLGFDWILALCFDVIAFHAEMESLSVILYFMYFLTNFHSEIIEELDQEKIDSEQRLTKMMLDQSIETLAYTIDAKDRYTKGHSFRVAKYARMIAGLSGKSEEECREVYLAGLLHDIGKISINGKIINKQGKLTDEEYEKIKTHPVKGAMILEKMKSIPFLQNGAKYHHERYDGKGYPSGLKGEEIPEIARIIAVADAYDAMTSFRSYRDTMERNLVKQEIWKGIGTQFDPQYAKIMIALIDADPNYEMREIPDRQDELIFDDHPKKIVWPSKEREVLYDYVENAEPEYSEAKQEEALSLAYFIQREKEWCNPTTGFVVSTDPGRIRFKGTTHPEGTYVWCVPTVLVYTSDDGEVLGPNYVEFGVFVSSGYGWKTGPSTYEKSAMVREEGFESWENWMTKNHSGLAYMVCARVEEDQVVLSMENGLLTMNARLGIPAMYKKKVHIAFTGMECEISELERL